MANKKTDEVKVVKKEEKIDLEEIKKELTDYVDDKIRTELVENIERANKRVIKEKNIKIIWRDFLVLILLGICCFLVYTLYNINYFGISIDEKQNSEKKEEVNKSSEEIEEEIVEPTLDELKTKYSYLLNNYVISDESIYLEDLYNGNLTNELKNYYALNKFDFTSLTMQDDYNIINEYSFVEKYKELFDSEYVNTSFNYNGNIIRYIGVINSYISTSVLEYTNSFIKREIISINVNDKIVSITTVEGVVKDNKLYNPLTKEEIENFNNNLLDYEDKLVKITYVFNNGKLDSITK